MAGRQIKISLLKEIETRRNVLFGASNDKLKKEDKARLWKEVFEIGQSNGLFIGRDWPYVRDVYWPNIRKATMVKIDNMKQNGAGEGLETKLNEIDDLVLQIIGKGSLAESLNVSKTFQDMFEKSSVMKIYSQENGTTTLSIYSYAPKMNGVSAKKKKTEMPEPQTVKEKKTNLDAKPEMPEPQTVKQKKTNLEIDYLELRNQKLCLEVIKMEKELGLFPCEIAKKYYPDT